MKQNLIYTDGACLGNPGPGGWAAIILQSNEMIKEIGGSEEATTNNRMEMAAVIESLAYLKQNPESSNVVKIWTDSKYIISGITSWIVGWKKNGWNTQSGKPVENQDLWKKLDDLNQIFVVSWNHVPGHAGIAGNERCDEIAVEYSQGSIPHLFEGPFKDYQIDLEEPSQEIIASAKKMRSKAKSKSYKGGTYLSLIGGSLKKHSTWPECEGRTKGVSGAKFKKCKNSGEEKSVATNWGVADQLEKL